MSIETIIGEVETQSVYFNDISDSIVNMYSSHLDTIMSSIYTDIVCQQDCPINIIEKYFLELSNLLYFVSDKVEKLGIYDDISKSRAKEVYNNAYLDAVDSATGKKPTANELTAMSETASKEESILNSVYNRSYKILKNKIDAAQSMMMTLSKIYSKRIQDVQISSSLGIENKSERIALME